jgi:uncharacterized protein YukE
MSDWDLLHTDGDPAPGNPELIRLLATDVASTANLAQEARLAVMRAGSDATMMNWRGDAANAFHAAFEPIAPDLGMMAESYDGVVSALNEYASRLEAIQAQVVYAVNRARVASQRKQLTDDQLGAVNATIRRLSGQLALVESERRSKTVEATLYAGDPVLAATHADDLNRLRSTQALVQQSLDSSRANQQQLQRESDGAQGDLDAARRDAAELREERIRAEQVAAAAIAAALEQQLKNKSNFQRVVSAAAHLPDDAAHLAADVVTAGLDAIAVIRQALGDIDLLIHIAMFVLVVIVIAVAIVSVVATGGLSLGAIAFMTEMAAPLMTELTAAAFAADKAKLATTAILATAGEFGYRDPQGQRVGFSDVFWDSVGTVSDGISAGDPASVFDNPVAQQGLQSGLVNFKDAPMNGLRTIKSFAFPPDPEYPPPQAAVKLLDKAHTWGNRASKVETFAQKEYDRRASQYPKVTRDQMRYGAGCPVVMPAFSGGGGGSW